jgi:hypothetical protein
VAEIAGIDAKIRRAFSRRRIEIEAEMTRRGVTGGRLLGSPPWPPARPNRRPSRKRSCAGRGRSGPQNSASLSTACHGCRGSRP